MEHTEYETAFYYVTHEIKHYFMTPLTSIKRKVMNLLMSSPRKVLCERTACPGVRWALLLSQTHVAKNSGCVYHLDGEAMHSLAKQLPHLILFPFHLSVTQ